MKELYEVEVDLVMYVMAEDESHAIDVAQRHANEEIDNLLGFEFSAVKPEYCFANWENSYPYGSDTNQTVGEIFKAKKEDEKKQAEREEWDRRQLKMFAE